jgi:UDP-N-acetylglucosamine 2-epimerase (non-hydrolysing)/GDP/UDP-N,N'-diacetylbacillosamine 2-epimerase (hydrolysing)
VRRIGVVSVARSDYGIYLPVLREISAVSDLSLQLFVGGMHLSPEFGSTVRVVEADGFDIAARVEMLLSSDSPEGIAKSTGLGVMGFAQAYAAHRPDILVVLGDRFEMMAATLAALPFKIPVAHIHGGEVTEGAMDEAHRHSMTKLSHLHFVSTEEYGRRVRQLGEEPWRITVSGAPSLDNLRTVKLLSNAELEARIGLPLSPAPLLVTVHSATLEFEQAEWQTQELLAALEASGHPVVFTAPNADTGGRIISRLIGDYCQRHSNARLVDNLGTQAYFSLMAKASAMVGNSSSGIIEAASFELPVVNIGVRQRGRTRSGNVIDVGHGREEIQAAIARALSSSYRDGLRGIKNAYGAHDAAKRIVEVLRSVALDERLVMKKFCDCVCTTSASGVSV